MPAAAVPLPVENRPFPRVLQTKKGERFVAGPRLQPDGERDKKMSQDICQRLERDMKARGGGELLWRTREPCQTCWKRLPIGYFAGAGEPQGGEKCTFGKCAGYALKEVYRDDNLYCQ